MKVELIKELKRKGRRTLEVGHLATFTNDYANELIKKKIAKKPGVKPVEIKNEKND